MSRPLISVISPVYGCTSCLEALVDAVWHALDGTDLDWELILVDDRGPDDPWPLIEQITARDNRVRGLRLLHNHGQHLAIWAGLEIARGDWVAVIDCDLQDDPSVIPALYHQAISDNVHAVVVDRGEWQDSRFRRWASRSFHKLLNLLSGLNLDSNVGLFGLYSRRMVNVLLSFGDKEVFLPVMISLTGMSRSKFTLDRSSRLAGRSAYDLKRLIRLAVAMIIRFSDRPLKLSILLGLGFSGLAAVFSVIVLLGWATGAADPPGWTSLILSLWFLSGLILAVLGVHGFYMGRIFAEVKKRPRILVEQTTADESNAQ